MITFGNCNISDEQIAKNYGFIYKITVKNRKYIGQKCFSKGLNWRTYTSSNKEIKDLCKNNDALYEIICLCSTKRELTYQETRHLFINDVLNDVEYCNGNILGKFYRGRLK